MQKKRDTKAMKKATSSQSRAYWPEERVELLLSLNDAGTSPKRLQKLLV
jgi:hypothetical protein